MLLLINNALCSNHVEIDLGGFMTTSVFDRPSTLSKDVLDSQDLDQEICHF